MHPRLIAKRSLVWEHFKQTSLKVVTCGICKKDLSFFGNTTNMKEHLRRKHKIITAPVIAAQSSSCDKDRIDEKQRNNSSTDIPSSEQASCHIQPEVSPTSKSCQETIPLSVNSVAAASPSCVCL